MQKMFVPHRKHTSGTPRPVMGVALLFYMQMMFVPHRKDTSGTPRPVTGIALLFLVQMMFVPHMKLRMGHHGLLRGFLYFVYADNVHTSQETPLWASTACYGDRFIFYMWMMFVSHWKHGGWLYFFAMYGTELRMGLSGRRYRFMNCS
jgi:hypothetical protein